MKNVAKNSIEQNKRTVDPLVWFYVWIFGGIILVKFLVIPLIEAYQRIGAILK